MDTIEKECNGLVSLGVFEYNFTRKQPQENTEYWGKHAPEIRNSAFNAMDEIEQKYPDEVAKLNGEFPAKFNSQNVPEELREQLTKAFINTDWEHGFNSGCLAAFRFALTALDRELYWNDEFEEWLPTGGIEDAVSEFPELDTRRWEKQRKQIRNYQQKNSKRFSTTSNAITTNGRPPTSKTH